MPSAVLHRAPIADRTAAAPRAIVIVSTGRTGTKAIAEYVARGYPEVRALHEPRPTRRLRSASFRLVSGRLERAQAAETLRRARARLLATTRTPFYLESNPTLCGFLEVLDEVFARPLVLHVVRDPRTYVRSAINFGSLHGIRGLLSRVLPFWTLKPEQFADAGPLRWASMSDVARAAWFWSTVNRHLDRGAELFGERYRRVRFEDLFDVQKRTMRDTVEWFGLPFRPESFGAGEGKINASRTERLPRFEAWSSYDSGTLLHFCGEEAREYGYQGAGLSAPLTTAAA